MPIIATTGSSRAIHRCRATMVAALEKAGLLLGAAVALGGVWLFLILAMSVSQ
jgi:hypothetical protein